MQQYWLWLALLPGLNIRQKLALLEHFSEPEAIFCADRAAFSHMEEMTEQVYAALQNKDLTKPRQIVKQCQDLDIGILTFGSAAYPARLRNIDNPPLVLYYKGFLPDFTVQPAIAVVGTRKATGYGTGCAQSISRQIAACGGIIVSGVAEGIDAAAMAGALTVETPVIGVLGCGVDVVYPKSNANLFQKVLGKGCLLSEYLPGTKAMPWHFPARNRIISGIANGVLVIEAPEKSGALITASRAYEQGRDIFAVPANIDTQTCAGSNALLQDCATAVFCGWDVMKLYQPMYPNTVRKQEPPALKTAAKFAQETPQTVTAPIRSDKKDIDNSSPSPYIGIGNLSEEEQSVVTHLTHAPCALDDVVQKAGIPAAQVLRILTVLELKGVVVNHPGKRVSLKK